MHNEKTKIFVAMSGGVDSSVAAYLLHSQGFEVTGVYMKNWSEESFGSKIPKNRCPWRDDVKQVRSVCKVLGVPMKIFNFEREYTQRVIDPFFKGQLRGKTPNPDVVCNRAIKFDLFIKRALKEGADLVATGHYIRLKKISEKNQQDLAVLPAKDKQKDQSYFLCTVTKQQLQKVIFPLGKYKKSEVRKIAKKAGLPNAERPESMGICFVGEVKMKDFLKTRIQETEGDIVDTNGKKLGTHLGLPFYTIGQRQGLGISGPVPYYVCGKNIGRNQLIVTQGSRSKFLFSKEVILKSLSWQLGTAPPTPSKCQARIRYRQPLQGGVLKREGKRFVVAFYKNQRAVTSGQYCAIYLNGILLGGGEIAKARL